MEIPSICDQTKTAAAALIALFLLNTQPASAQDSPNCSIAVQSSILMSGSALIDSFDSSNPAKSTDGLYDPAKRQMNAEVCINNNINSDLRNCFVYGNVEYSGPVIRNTANVTGYIATPFNSAFPQNSDPNWTPGTFAQHTGGGSITTIPANTFTAAGTADSPTRVKVVGDFTYSGKTPFKIVSSDGTDRYITIWVTGKFAISGSDKVKQDPAAHVTWIVDKDINTTGEAYVNESAKAANLSFLGVGAGKINVSGSGNLIAVVDGPSRTLAISGKAGVCGALIGSTLTISSNCAVHYDEALE